MPKVRIWNRTRSKAESLLDEAYCEFASSLEEISRTCDIVQTCLTNDEVALSIYRTFFTAENVSGTIFVDHSTLYPTTATILQAEAKQKGAHFLSCPVFGPPAAAKSAGLLIALSGDESTREIMKPILVPAIGKGVIDCGDNCSKGALLKLLGNNCILGTIELLSESFTLAEKTGFDANLFYEFIRKSLGPLRWSALTQCRAMVSSSSMGQLWQEGPRRSVFWQDRLHVTRGNEGCVLHQKTGSRDIYADTDHRSSLESPDHREKPRR